MFRRQNERTIRSHSLLKSTLGVGIAVALAVGASLVSAERNHGHHSQITVQDIFGVAGLAKVAVISAESGRLVASGLTDEATGSFSFRDRGQDDFVVVANSATGFVGASKVEIDDDGGNEDEDSTVMITDIAVGDLEFIPNRSDVVLITGNDPLTGDPLKNARVMIITWDGFALVARGKTDAQGQFIFTVPQEYLGHDFLCILWKGDRSIILKVAQHVGVPPSGGALVSQWPAF